MRLMYSIRKRKFLFLFLILFTTACNGGNGSDKKIVTTSIYLVEDVIADQLKIESVSFADNNNLTNPENSTITIADNDSMVFELDYGNNNYSITFADTTYMTDLSYLQWPENFSFSIIEIADMPRDKWWLADKINENIKQAMTSWVRGKVIYPDEFELSINCHTARYFSFVNAFNYYYPRAEVINDFITIDMITGERVFLNDLIEINDEFVSFLKNNQDKLSGPDYQTWTPGPADLNSYTNAELLEELHQCSLTQEQVIENGYGSIEETIGPLIFRKSFFLREGMLVIVFGDSGGGGSYITLDVNDIEQFLKVEKW
ncbi:MAG: hypothetical protein LBV33_03890 [Lachnospiraceae bacterium]|jgi:hypothetical protein|nr:hypothetical protein [Lachnospiraceae bacterium]